MHCNNYQIYVRDDHLDNFTFPPHTKVVGGSENCLGSGKRLGDVVIMCPDCGWIAIPHFNLDHKDKVNLELQVPPHRLVNNSICSGTHQRVMVR